MKVTVNDWSVVATPDGSGVALKPWFEDTYEICVAIRNGCIQVTIHKDGQDDSLAETYFSINQPKGEEA